MKATLRSTLAGVMLAFGVLMFSAPAALAHKTPNDRRTVPQCNKLLKPAKRAACRRCVTRKVPHHVHPAGAPTQRCRPNNGKP